MDMIKYVNALEASGLKRQQAEVQIQAMDEFMRENFATKADLKLVETELRYEIISVRSDLRSEIKLAVQESTEKISNKITQTTGIGVAVLGLLMAAFEFWGRAK